MTVLLLRGQTHQRWHVSIKLHSVSIFFLFVVFSCVKTLTMFMNGTKESSFMRENPMKSSTHIQKLYRQLTPSWHQANLTRCGLSLPSFTNSMASWKRPGWYLTRRQKWIIAKWMTWLLCGASLVKWKSDTSELFYFRRRKGNQFNPSFWKIWLLM